MGRRFLMLLLSLLFVLTCTLAEQGPGPSQPAAAAAQATAQPQATAEPETSFVELLLNVAREELGYTEGKNNYTKYGKWSGDPNAQWCAEFLCWSVDQTDKRYGTNLLKVQYPLYSGSNVGRDWFIAHGRYVDRRGTIDDWGAQWFLGKQAPMAKDQYIPQPGDWMYFTWRNGRDTDHVAMVEYTDVNKDGQTVVHAIEGNNPAKVARAEYLLSDPKILGYGTVTQVAGVTMRPGSKGEFVRGLQGKLTELGLMKAEEIDGVYGAKTAIAIRAFQTNHMPGKQVTGVADMETQFAIQDEIEYRLDSDPNNWVVAGN